MSESNATTICPSEVTLQASAAKKAALRFSPDCDATVIDLTTTDDGDVCLNAQNLGIVHYIHDPEFPASAMNFSGNPLQSVALSTANANLTNVIVAACNLTSLVGFAFPRGRRASSLHLDASWNSLSAIEKEALPRDLISLSLSHNAFQALVNASFPSTLEHLLLAGNAIEKIELTVLPANLQLLDLTDNPLQSVEIRESDIPVFQQARIVPLIDQAACADPQATLKEIHNHRICVIADAIFDLKKNAYAASPTDPEPETVVSSTGGSSSQSTTSIVLAVVYAVIGVALLVAAVFVGKKVLRKRREQRASDQINEYLDATGLTPPREILLSQNHTSTNAATTAAAAPPFKTLPRLQSQSPRGFLTPFLRVLSGVKHEPTASSSLKMQSAISLSDDSSGVSVDTMRSSLGLEKYRIAEDDLKFGRVVSAGSFTHIYMAKFNENGKDKIGIARQLAPNLVSRDSETQKNFMDDVCRSSTIGHPNIVAFFGFYHLNNVVPGVVTEYLPNGDLESLLAVRPQIRQAFQWLQSESLPKTKAEIALDVIDALVYLHSLSSRMYFRNLRAKKVLLAEDFTAKLCAFAVGRTNPSASFISSSRSAEPLSASSPTSTGSSCCPRENSVAWMAPELLRGERDHNEQTEMYAFGVLLTELDTCELPYSMGIDDAERHQVATLVCAGCIRPSVATDCPVPIQELIQKCLSFSPEDRPHGVEVQYTLRKLVNRSRRRSSSESVKCIDNDDDEKDAEEEAEQQRVGEETGEEAEQVRPSVMGDDAVLGVL